MTTRCNNGHPEILHDEFHCPLCAAQDDLHELGDLQYNTAIRYDALNEEIEELGLADVQHALAEADEQRKLASTATAALRKLRYELGCMLGKRPRDTMTKRLARVEKLMAEEKLAA